MKINSLNFPGILVAGLSMLLLFSGCSKDKPEDTQPERSVTKEKSSEKKDFVTLDDDAGPNDKQYLEAARPFAVALAARDYATMYGMLSSHAKARMTMGQFVEPKTDEEYKVASETVYENVSPEQFAELMQKMESLQGTPVKPLELYVQSTDAATLSGQTGGDVTGIDVMFAIGNMPASIPNDIRKASLRGKTGVTLSDADLVEIAKQYEMTVDELKKSEDFNPYFNYKIVLVEDAGTLKVGHFEFMSPSMMD